MGLVRVVPIDWSMEDFVESLELPIGCGEVLKAHRLNHRNIIKGIVELIMSRAHSIAKGYNKQAHDAISNPLPNGCALGNSQPDFLQSQGKMLEDLSSLLLSIVAPCSELPLPTN
ncbi:unnamed protein product, partial [Leptidea sinapis]